MSADEYEPFNGAAQAAIRAMGLEDPSDDEVNHMTILVESFATYRKRDKEYGALWKRSGFVDNMRLIRSKAQRAEFAPSHRIVKDSIIDLINFAVFYYLNYKAGRRGE